jgi:hypothetical protein
MDGRAFGIDGHVRVCASCKQQSSVAKPAPVAVAGPVVALLPTPVIPAETRQWEVLRSAAYLQTGP